jgi:hypothetical protein
LLFLWVLLVGMGMGVASFIETRPSSLQRAYERIQVGMTQEQVEEVVGEDWRMPYRIRGIGTENVYFVRVRDDTHEVVVIFLGRPRTVGQKEIVRYDARPFWQWVYDWLRRKR